MKTIILTQIGIDSYTGDLELCYEFEEDKNIPIHKRLQHEIRILKKDAIELKKVINESD